jgi:hypothetical protein
MRFCFALLLVQCGVPFMPVGTCNPVGFVALQVEDSRPCECLERLVADAVETASVITGHRQTFEGLSVWVHASDGALEAGTHVDGQYHPESDSIEVERFARSLAHELMHRADVRAGATWEATAAHQGWAERGWSQAGDAFWHRWNPADSSTFCF